MSFVKEFKEFAIKGNVMDMAVGVIIGGAFGKIVDRKSTTHKPLIPSIEVWLPFVQEGESCFKYADMRYRNLKTINAFFSTQILYDDKLKNLSKKRLNQLGRFSFFWTFRFGDYNFIIFFIKKTHQKWWDSFI